MKDNLARQYPGDELDDKEGGFLLDEDGDDGVTGQEFSGVHVVSEKQRLESIRRQKVIDAAKELVFDLGVLFDGLENGDLTIDLVNRFHENVARITTEQGLKFENSNVLKMLEGLRFEFEVIIKTSSDYLDDAKVRRLKAVKKVFDNFSTAVLNVGFDGDWNFLERAVPSMLGILPLEQEVIERLRVNLLSKHTHKKALMVISNVREKAKTKEPSNVGRINMQEQLDLFAEGGVTLEQLQFPERIRRVGLGVVKDVAKE
jgi:hypothetical protein